MKDTKLRLTGRQHAALRAHLFPGDGLEAVALALCGRHAGETECLTVQRVIDVPHRECRRERLRVSWSPAAYVSILEEAMRRGLAVVKFHSHPDGTTRFSEFDNAADRELFGAVAGWVDGDGPHASAIMLPSGVMFGRSVFPNGEQAALASIVVAGDDLHVWQREDSVVALPEFTRRHAQLFGNGTTGRLRRLSAAVVGCSGTGSIVVELLARLGIGRLVLVDHDRIEEKNLNRILNATMADAREKRLKVEVLVRAVTAMGLETEVITVPENLATAAAVRAVAGCDVVFGCMDGAEGRHALNRLCVFYVLPYFDVGVRLDGDGNGGIEQVSGAVRYVQPDGASLLSRGVYTMEDVRAEGMKRTTPELYAEQLGSRYIRGVAEDRPAVISVNMQLASLTVNEFLARLHPYRMDPNAEFATVSMSLSEGVLLREPDREPCGVFARHLGRGDVTPLLEMPELSERREEE